MKLTLMVLPLLPLVLLVGCASPPRGEPIEGEGFEVLETLPPSGSLGGTDLYPFHRAEWTYRVLEPQKGAEIVYTVRPAEDFNAEVLQEAGEERTEFWSRNDEGSIVLTAVIEHQRDALTLFEPPLVIAPAELAAGEALQDEVRMRVVSATNHRQQRESGTAQRTIEYVDDQRIRTPLGEFTAKHVVTRFEADLALADAENVESYWVVPGQGVVVMQFEEQIRVLGVLGSTSRRLMVQVR